MDQQPRRVPRVHQIRARSDVILVGINTALADDPLLSARGVESLRTLRRSVLDSNLRLPPESQLVRTAAGEVTVFCSRDTFRKSPKVDELQSLGIEIIPIKSDPHGVGLSLDDVLFDLDNVATHVLVEAGPTLARSFIEQNFVDRVWIIRSPNPISDPSAPRGREARLSGCEHGGSGRRCVDRIPEPAQPRVLRAPAVGGLGFDFPLTLSVCLRETGRSLAPAPQRLQHLDHLLPIL
jgi:riboflavin biosynthesis pyrimidine reductase